MKNGWKRTHREYKWFRWAKVYRHTGESWNAADIRRNGEKKNEMIEVNWMHRIQWLNAVFVHAHGTCPWKGTHIHVELCSLTMKTKQNKRERKKQTSTLLFGVWCVHFGPDNKIIIFKMWELQMFLSSTRMWMWQKYHKTAVRRRTSYRSYSRTVVDFKRDLMMGFFIAFFCVARPGLFFQKHFEFVKFRELSQILFVQANSPVSEHPFLPS